MAGLQRSSVSFRRQGSSGLVWENRFPHAVSSSMGGEGGGESVQFDGGMLPRVNTIDRSRSTGGAMAFRTSRVSAAIEPPSPKVSACGLCSGFGKSSKSGRTKPGKRRSF